MKKSWKRKLVWFTIALILTLLVGTVVLVTVLQYKKKEKAAWQEQMQAEQIAEINAQTDAETQMHAGAGVQIGSGQDDNTGGEDREDASLPEIETDQKEQNPQEEQKTDPAEEKGKAVMTFAGDICFHDAYANMYALSARSFSSNPNSSVSSPRIMSDFSKSSPLIFTPRIKAKSISDISGILIIAMLS